VFIRPESLDAKAIGPDSIYVIMQIINKIPCCVYTNQEERVMGD
jgi:hypothetical protein